LCVLGVVVKIFAKLMKRRFHAQRGRLNREIVCGFHDESLTAQQDFVESALKNIEMLKGIIIRTWPHILIALQKKALLR